MADDGHFHLEPQSHVTPKAAPILEGKLLGGLAVHRAVSLSAVSTMGRGWGWGSWDRRWAPPEQGGGSRPTVEGTDQTTPTGPESWCLLGSVAADPRLGKG